MFNWLRKMRQPKEIDVGLSIFLDDFTTLDCEHRHPQTGWLCVLPEGHIPPSVHQDIYHNEWKSEW